MSPVSAPADKRFRRAHVKPGRRRRWRTWSGPLARWGLIALVASVALYEAGVMVAHARLLQIREISVRGNTRIQTPVVIAALEGLKGQSILWSGLASWRERLLASPWVKDAVLRRVLPSTIEVVVRERVPIGLGRIHGALYLVDEQGVVIDEYGPAYESLDLPMIDGLSSSDGDGGTVDRARAELAGRLIASLASSPEISDKLSQVDVSDPRNAAVILNDDPAVIYVGTDRFLPRLQSYLQLAPTMRERVAGIDLVDLRFDDRNRIYVTPAAKGSRAVSAPAAPAAAAPQSKKQQR